MSMRSEGRVSGVDDGRGRTYIRSNVRPLLVNSPEWWDLAAVPACLTPEPEARVGCGCGYICALCSGTHFSAEQEQMRR
jgi:hypothetical protein